MFMPESIGVHGAARDLTHESRDQLTLNGKHEDEVECMINTHVWTSSH